MTKKCRTCGREYVRGERFCSVDGTPLNPPPESSSQRSTVILSETMTDTDTCDDDLVGMIINNRYRIARKLGEGGTSIVYLALRESINEPVAIKFLKDELARRVGSIERFIIEARASSRVDHPHIVSVFDFGRGRDARYYLVMEYVQGTSLISAIKKTRGFDQVRTMGILHQLLSAIGAAHRENIIHRDLKPENVILTNDRGKKDSIKVLDFGLAKFIGNEAEVSRLTRQGVILGTPYYMSPEQARCEKVDSRTDLYSVGVMAYEMLTGTVPFRGGSPVEVLNRHILKKPTPLSIARPDVSIHPDLEQLVMRLLAKSPERRYQTAEETKYVLEKTLDRVLNEPPVSDMPSGREHRLQGISISRPKVSTPPPPRPTETTIWEAPGLLEDSSRLVKLWDERITEVSDKFWGEGNWPPEIIKAVEAIRRYEREIENVELQMLPIKEEIDTIELSAREEEAALRFERLDLVARQCVVREVLAGDLDLSNLEDLSKRISLLGMDDLLKNGEIDSHQIRALHTKLDSQINDIDRQARKLIRKTKRDIASRNRVVHGRVNEIRGLRQQQVPKCTELLERLKREAELRQGQNDELTAVAEVAGALEIFQTLLGAIQKPRETESL